MLFAETEAISYFKLHWLHIAIYFNPQRVLEVADAHPCKSITDERAGTSRSPYGKILSFPTTLVGSALAF
jgi:hypothetical protein